MRSDSHICHSIYPGSDLQATNIEFMSEYGNPTLGLDEAGYYLVTLNVAANYIEKLTVEDLKKNSGLVIGQPL